MRTISKTLALGFACATLSLSAMAQDRSTTLPVQRYAEINYVNGGVGDEEIAQMRAGAEDFNLKMVFAEKSGAYIADAAVVVSAMNGQKVFELESVGPMLIMKLPAGSYQVQATANGHAQQKIARVSGRQQSVVNFLW